MQGEFICAAMIIESVQSSLPRTGLVFVFFNWKPRLFETCCFEEIFFLIGYCVSVSARSTVFRIW